MVQVECGEMRFGGDKPEEFGDSITIPGIERTKERIPDEARAQAKNGNPAQSL